jgi:hypothetical protein
MRSSTPPFDPLAMSSPGAPVMHAGVYASGVHPLSGAYPVLPPPAARRGSSGRRTGAMIVVVLVLIWIIVGGVWLAGRDDRAAPGGAAAAPAAGAGGLYRFADSEAAPGTPTADSAAAPRPAANGAKPNKKIKKPKDEEDD